MHRFDYFRPESLGDALALLDRFGEEGVAVAGATDVWVGLKAAKIAPNALISLRAIPNLTFLRHEDRTLVIGATCPHASIEDSLWVAEHFPALHRACAAVGSRQIRNVGTVGGNLCNAAPSADSAVPLLLYDAVCVAQDALHMRQIAVGEFFLGPGRTALRGGELLTEIRVPAPPARTYADYWKLTRRKGMELPILGVGARVSLAEDGRTVAEARIALGVAGPTPLRVRTAEATLEGEVLSRDALREAAELAASEAQVRDSWRGKAWYRREMIRVLIPRVLARAGAPIAL